MDSKAPTDFSEFHAEQLRRQRIEEEVERKWNKNIQEMLEKKEEKPEPARQQRAMSEEEIKLWEELEQSEEVSNDGLGEKVEGDDFDPQEWRDLCKVHIEKRIRILESKKEERLTRAEHDSMARFDRMRIQHFNDYYVDPEQDKVALDFIAERIDGCANRETLQGYKWLRDNYTPAIGPDIYFLAMWYGTRELAEFERWALFGF